MCVKLLIADDEDMIRNGIAKYIKQIGRASCRERV